MKLNNKKIHILKIAEKLFAEKGFDGTSIRTIARAADINIAMVSYYFGSKEKLLEGILFFRSTDFKMEFENIIAVSKPYFEKLEEIVTLIIQRVHKNRHIYKIVNFEYSNNNREINFDSYNNQKKENTILVQNFIQEGQDAGIFSKNINTSLIFATIIGTYFHIYYNKKYYMKNFGLQNEKEVDNFIVVTLIPHIQQTIKALLTNEN
jgi:hypothetical protein